MGTEMDNPDVSLTSGGLLLQAMDRLHRSMDELERVQQESQAAWIRFLTELEHLRLPARKSRLR